MDRERLKTIKVGVDLPLDLSKKMLVLLREFMDVFAWSAEDLTGIPRGLASTV